MYSRSSASGRPPQRGDGPDVDRLEALAGEGHLPEGVAVLDHRYSYLGAAFVYLVEMHSALLEDEEPLGALLGAVEDVAFLQEGVRQPLRELLHLLIFVFS